MTVGVAVAAGCGGNSDNATSTSTVDVTDTSGGGSRALAGTVGPGFEISLDKTDVAAGTYTLTVEDRSPDHNFRLTGPGGVDVMTQVPETGKKTFTVDLEAGTYTFVCEPHASSMRGTLKVS
jgi:plastocyanin